MEAVGERHDFPGEEEKLVKLWEELDAFQVPCPCLTPPRCPLAFPIGFFRFLWGNFISRSLDMERPRSSSSCSCPFRLPFLPSPICNQPFLLLIHLKIQLIIVFIELVLLERS